jgi:hypothetical protein
MTQAGTLSLALAVAWFGAPASAEMPQATSVVPTAITFTILQSDCHGAGADTLTLSMNGIVLATVPTAHGCNCYNPPQVVTITDPALLAHFDPDVCNWFRVTSSPFPVIVASVKVTVSTAASPIVSAFDGSGTIRAVCEDARLRCSGSATASMERRTDRG